MGRWEAEKAIEVVEEVRIEVWIQGKGQVNICDLSLLWFNQFKEMAFC